MTLALIAERSAHILLLRASLEGVVAGSETKFGRKVCCQYTNIGGLVGSDNYL
jgi:hypothetical protein